MTESRAALTGFAAAAVVSPLLMAIRALTSEPALHGLTDAILVAGAAFLVFLPVSILAAVIVGVPGFLLCRRLGLVTWWIALPVGALAGGIVSLARLANEPVTEALVQYVPLGALAGMVFWLVWKLTVTHATT
jgi:hypothetical protein